MRNTITLLALLVALSPLVSPVSGQTPTRPDRERMETMQQRRAQLEQQVRSQFLDKVTERLSLDTGQRERLDGVLERGADARQALARESRQLRIQLIRTVAADDGALVTYQRLLDRMQELRAREHALEQQEAAALSDFLDARQHAQFLVLRMQLTEQVRGLRGEGPGRPPADRPRDRGRRPGGAGG